MPNENKRATPSTDDVLRKMLQTPPAPFTPKQKPKQKTVQKRAK